MWVFSYTFIFRIDDLCSVVKLNFVRSIHMSSLRDANFTIGHANEVPDDIVHKVGGARKN